MKNKLLGIFLVLMFALTGCKYASAQNLGAIIAHEVYLQSEGDEPTICDKALLLVFLTEVPNGEAYYTITSTLFEAERVNVHFPKIKMDNQDQQEKVNTLIMDEKLRILDIFPDRENLTLDVNYEIKFSSNRLLSIAYTGIGFVQGATRPTHFFYTLNINIETGEKIVLSDIVSVDEEFITILLSDDTTHLNTNEELGQFVREIILEERFLHMIQNAENIGFYFTAYSLGISIDGLGGAAGDHAELEIRYEALF